MAGGGLGSYQDDDPGAGVISDINVTPLVDVVLVLLIIFMVTAKLIVARGIDIESPKTASGSEVKSTLAVTVDKDGDVYIRGTKYTDRKLAIAEVEKAWSSNPKVQAIISADRRVPHGDVMRAIDIVKQGKVTKFALTSEPLPKDESN